MNVFWSDREGKSPPPSCKFSLNPFSSAKAKAIRGKQRELSPAAVVKVIQKTFEPTKEVWIKNVERALNLIHQGDLEKVVLARKCVLELETAPDPFALTASLKQKAEGAFVFCLQFPQEAFLGATPERLFARKNGQIWSEAIAGTRRRGASEIEDEVLKQELLSSPKDLRELAPVQTHLEKALTPLCKSPLSFTPVSIHSTRNVQHLYTQCSGTLKGSIAEEQILSRLHPTPALCGLPRQKAFSLIQELEPFERGLYGGAIGWTNGEDSEWIVGIRSCLLRGKTATLFSGTGIVKGSNPEAEWDELNQKLKLYDGIFHN